MWDLVAFGLPGRRQPPIHGHLPRGGCGEAAKRWAVEELPRRRGRGVGGSLRTRVHSLAWLSEMLRLREDSGHISGALGRADISGAAEPARLPAERGHRHPPARSGSAATSSGLARIRALGLTRPGGPAAGLPVTSGAHPRHPSAAPPDEPRDCRRRSRVTLRPARPPETGHGAKIRAGVELVIDTGRRPDETHAGLGLPDPRHRRFPGAELRQPQSRAEGGGCRSPRPPPR